MTGPLVVITGASSGIGLALARAFAKEGNALLLIARHMKPIDGLPAERTVYAQADVADYGALERAIRDAEARFGKTACLINNAGMADARAFTEVEPAAFSHEIDVNLKGTLNATKVVIGDMTAAGSGTIINISSVSDRKTSPVAMGYTASKYAVRATSESLREAVGMQGVRVINVAPAYIKTNIHARHGHQLRGILPPPRQSRLPLGRGAGRGRAVLLETAALDLHPRHRGSADPLGLLTSHFGSPLEPACLTFNTFDAPPRHDIVSLEVAKWRKSND